ASQPVAKVAHDLVDAENLLNDHDAGMGAGSGRFCEIAGKRAVRTFDRDGFAAHFMPPWYRECRDRDCSGPDAPRRGGERSEEAVSPRDQAAREVFSPDASRRAMRLRPLRTCCFSAAISKASPWMRSRAERARSNAPT